MRHAALGLVIAAATLLGPWARECQAYTANKVWFEFRKDGRYRVHVNYTVPELKEFREAHVDFAKKREAERFYWDLIRGADFYPPSPAARQFVQNPLEPDPW